MKIIENLLKERTKNRPGERNDPQFIVVHWTAAPMQRASVTRDWFASGQVFGSAHYIIEPLGGDVIQCIPDGEIAYHCASSDIDPASQRIYTDLKRALVGEKNPNYYSIGIEINPLNNTGLFSKEALDCAKDLIRHLCAKHNINKVLRHYDIVGWKDCPRYFVNNTEAWKQFLEDLNGNE